VSELRFNLDLIELPIPCTVPWESMRGSDRVRHCGQCNQNVYQLSEMSREEAEELIKRKDGKACLRFFRRPDGTVVTRDCVAIRWSRAVWSALWWIAVAVLWLLTFYRVFRPPEPTPTFSKISIGAVCSSKCWEPVEKLNNEQVARL